MINIPRLKTTVTTSIEIVESVILLIDEAFKRKQILFFTIFNTSQ